MLMKLTPASEIVQKLKSKFQTKISGQMFVRQNDIFMMYALFQLSLLVRIATPFNGLSQPYY